MGTRSARACPAAAGAHGSSCRRRRACPTRRQPAACRLAAALGRQRWGDQAREARVPRGQQRGCRHWPCHRCGRVTRASAVIEVPRHRRPITTPTMVGIIAVAQRDRQAELPAQDGDAGGVLCTKALQRQRPHDVSRGGWRQSPQKQAMGSSAASNRSRWSAAKARQVGVARTIVAEARAAGAAGEVQRPCVSTTPRPRAWP